MGTYRLTFSLYAGLVLPVMFPLQDFSIINDHIIDSVMEQDTDGLCFFWEPVLK